jgi:hypothetical protein
MKKALLVTASLLVLAGCDGANNLGSLIPVTDAKKEDPKPDYKEACKQAQLSGLNDLQVSRKDQTSTVSGVAAVKAYWAKLCASPDNVPMKVPIKK